MTTEEIGARLMQDLKQLDQIAYVRFASVYRQFRDVGQFSREVDELRKSKG
jgi:transcriptional repressor NrdR